MRSYFMTNEGTFQKLSKVSNFKTSYDDALILCKERRVHVEEVIPEPMKPWTPWTRVSSSVVKRSH